MLSGPLCQNFSAENISCPQESPVCPPVRQGDTQEDTTSARMDRLKRLPILLPAVA